MKKLLEKFEMREIFDDYNNPNPILLVIVVVSILGFVFVLAPFIIAFLAWNITAWLIGYTVRGVIILTLIILPLLFKRKNVDN